MSAGLLTNQDIINSIKKTGKDYKLIIVPGIIFDIFGNDLFKYGVLVVQKSPSETKNTLYINI